ncbi:hypothetical protein FOXG_20050 [Fusarium oxysporum f. sp. lycopersici 4287]|uniref:Uncharacterized protein n=4 Tax=Fusarium oxysporum TaxID=5507 RepID=W9I0B2_FUSOX|nr:hypothetical protein FOXG_20050 [Fusarium oxysporum f. sp. lycopersici 4287]EWY86730.1 hypothetical protein FOYG_11143 [Fusarium oxysporum NRRL 32931]EXK37616.1 hypothetical protein FOMG_08280 [Fusarium oxysporum f. sp. melonis 26406]EXM30995.1 hypothetical protein FOTG_03877 [Fusarium oxysporum f. sp. vasinfectum 25433]KNB08664.1 hypothetical protein FOXG_20050 [Fusarium oxysporum f. sp. lycopersici 4287]
MAIVTRDSGESRRTGGTVPVHVQGREHLCLFWDDNLGSQNEPGTG